MNDSDGNPVRPNQIYMDAKDISNAHHYLVIPNPDQEGRIHYFSFLKAVDSKGLEGVFPLNSQPTLYPLDTHSLNSRRKDLQGELNTIERVMALAQSQPLCTEADLLAGRSKMTMDIVLSQEATGRQGGEPHSLT